MHEFNSAPSARPKSSDQAEAAFTRNRAAAVQSAPRKLLTTTLSTARCRTVAVLLCTTYLLAAHAVQACSPPSSSPLQLMAGEPPYRYARILLAEVVAVTAPARRRELEVWRQEKREIAARNRLAAAKYEAELEMAATNAPGDSPPPPPPEPAFAVPAPVLPMMNDAQTAVELFELEVLQGSEQGQTFVSAGGPCGNSPRVGHQYLVFIEYSGFAHFMQDRRPSLRQSVDEQFLQQVRACVHGQCPDPRQTGP